MNAGVMSNTFSHDIKSFDNDATHEHAWVYRIDQDRAVVLTATALPKSVTKGIEGLVTINGRAWAPMYVTYHINRSLVDPALVDPAWAKDCSFIGARCFFGYEERGVATAFLEEWRDAGCDDQVIYNKLATYTEWFNAHKQPSH